MRKELRPNRSPKERSQGVQKSWRLFLDFPFLHSAFLGSIEIQKECKLRNQEDEKIAEASTPLPSISRIWVYRPFSVKRIKLAMRAVEMKVYRAFIEAMQILRIMMSLHSAKDFSTIPRLYGIEESTHLPSEQRINLRDRSRA